MKRAVYHIFALIIVSIFSIAAIQVTEECDATALKLDLKKELKPEYKYDSSKTSRFSYKTKKQVKEIEVPLYMGEKYKFLFNTKGLTRDIGIEIYNKPTGHKKRQLLFKLEPKEDQHIYAFEPTKSRKMYVNYFIPEVEQASEIRDCMIMVVGYRLKIDL